MMYEIFLLNFVIMRQLVAFLNVSGSSGLPQNEFAIKSLNLSNEQRAATALPLFLGRCFMMKILIYS